MTINILEKYKCKHLDVMLEQAGNDSLGHAVLLIGPKYVGKSEWINKIIDNIYGKHVSVDADRVDIHWLETGSKIGEVRKFLQKLYVKSYGAHKVIGVIENIDQLSVESANTLLKTFEEPPKSVIMIFTASTLDLVLPTLRSRARIIQIPALEYNFLKPLVEKGKWPCNVETLLWLSQGYPGYVKHWQKNPELLELAIKLIAEWNLIISENYPARVVFAKEWSEMDTDTVNWVSLLWLRGMLFYRFSDTKKMDSRGASLKNVAEIDSTWNNVSLESLNEAINEILTLNKQKLSGNQRKNILEKILLTVF